MRQSVAGTNRATRLLHRLALSVALTAACGTEGSGCLAPTEFPVDQRIVNAVQIRLAQPGFKRIGDNVAEMMTAALGSRRLGFEPQCEGNVTVCCGLPADTCGITLDLEPRPGDPPRLSFRELDDGRPGLGVTFNTRIRTDRTLEVRISVPLLGSDDCEIDLDTAASGSPDVTIGASLIVEDDPLTQATRISLSDLVLAGVEKDDVTVVGTGHCTKVKGDKFEEMVAQLQEVLAEQAPKLIEVPLCKDCATDAECGIGGSCNADLVCEDASGGEEQPPRCLQELGTVGRFPAGELFGEIAGSAALDLYLVASDASATGGGLSFSGTSGVYLPTIEGVAPGAPGCAPAAPAPMPPDGGIEFSEMMSANALDDLGEFDFGVALHKSFLDRAGWALHQSGMFCTTIDTSTNEKLNADSLAIMFPSLVDLVDGANTPVAVRLRPQKPPTFRMDGKGGGLVVEFADFDVDFFINFRERSVRLFSARPDVAIPLALASDMDGAIVPILGDLADAFENIRITNPGLIAAPNQEIAAKFEAIGGLSINMLVGAIGDFELPGLPFLQPKLIEDGLRGLDDGQFLGLLGQFHIGPPADMPLLPSQRSVKTTAEVIAVRLPEAAAYAASHLEPSLQPSIELKVGGTGPLESPLEWQYRIDGGAWSRQLRADRHSISRIQLWVPGTHAIDVRARHWNRPESTDPSPVSLTVDLRPNVAPRAGAPATGAQASYSPDSKSENACASSSSSKGALWLVLAALFSLMALRRRSSTTLCILVAVVMSGQTACLVGTDTEKEKGPAYGRWSAVAANGRRAIASSYEAQRGDLVLGTVVASGVKAFEIVDEEGNVGAWTSVELVDNFAAIAYQDRGNGRLKFARESASGFDNHVVDESSGIIIGRYANLALRPGGGFAIAYLAEIDKDDGGTITQLRIAETSKTDPEEASDWTIEPLQFARVETSERAPADSVPLGTGLYSKLEYNSAGDPIIVYCDSTAPALMIATRAGGAWQTSVLDDDVATGPCAFAALVVAADDSVHVAYQTTVATEVRYVGLGPGSLNGIPAIVDDGARQTVQHPVGGSTAITLDADGQPIIVYQDGYTLELRLARQNGAEWVHDVAATGAFALGFSISLAWFDDQMIIVSGALDREKLQVHQATTTVVK